MTKYGPGLWHINDMIIPFTLIDVPGLHDSHGASDTYIMNLIYLALMENGGTNCIDTVIIVESISADRNYVFDSYKKLVETFGD